LCAFLSPQIFNVFLQLTPYDLSSFQFPLVKKMPYLYSYSNQTGREGYIIDYQEQTNRNILTCFLDFVCVCVCVCVCDGELGIDSRVSHLEGK
jgi:hypothetical protein